MDISYVFDLLVTSLESVFALTMADRMLAVYQLTCRSVMHTVLVINAEQCLMEPFSIHPSIAGHPVDRPKIDKEEN